MDWSDEGPPVDNDVFDLEVYKQALEGKVLLRLAIADLPGRSRDTARTGVSLMQ